MAVAICENEPVYSKDLDLTARQLLEGVRLSSQLTIALILHIAS